MLGTRFFVYTKYMDKEVMEIILQIMKTENCSPMYALYLFINRLQGGKNV